MERSLKPAILALLIASSILACHRQSQGYQFFVAGHTYGSPQRKAPGLHPPFVETFSKLKQVPQLKFGVLTGDIVYYSRDTFWDAVDRQLSELPVPVHFAVGNHDAGHHHPYRDRYGETYYSFPVGPDLCIVLNPGLGGWNIWQDQLAFLQTTLAKSHEYRYIFLFFHQVLWWEAEGPYAHVQPNSITDRSTTINFWPEIMPILYATERPVYCFAGDVGVKPTSPSLSLELQDNVTFIASGMGGRSTDHYLLVNIDSLGAINIWAHWLTTNQWEKLPLDTIYYAR